MEGAEVLGATPSDTIEAASTKTTVEVLPPPVGTSTINNSPTDVATADALVEGVSQLAQPVASSTIPPDIWYESTGQISDISPEKRGNLKIDEDYEQGDPWDKFSFNEIKGNCFVVAVGKNENSFGIYADLRKFKEKIEGFPACLYQSCDSYIQAHQYLEQYLQENIGNEKMETTAIVLAGTINFLGYEDLTKKKQDDARTLPKGIYIQNIMSKMQLLRSATITSLAM
jgi:hypothetical protein